MEVRFFISGEPQPQPRPRMVRGPDGKMRVVSTLDKKKQAWRKRVARETGQALMAAQEVTRRNLVVGMSGPVEVDMVFLMGTKDKTRHLRYKFTKPDKDNLEKMVLDGMEQAGMFRTGDSQVCTGRVSKVWVCEELGGEPGVMITVKPAGDCLDVGLNLFGDFQGGANVFTQADGARSARDADAQAGAGTDGTGSGSAAGPETGSGSGSGAFDWIE